ncbi:DMT family transporter [uncultured Ferrovibrio sp.]|jgi:drug/metabolite transporter (DMT)-like permease|uniref:DMT family transporter n=1 Tax=uncultured Ferrovibrio sp. TaxID=1576913 RepID=UPI002612195E|nr:DMT family transporter [uncultured Ferrovibrio sp.]
MTQMDNRAWAGLLFLSVLWGGSFFFVGVAVSEVPPLTIAAVRVLLAAAILLLVLRLSRLQLPRNRGMIGSFLVAGLLNNAVPFSLFFWAQSQIPSGLASILNAMTPIFTVLVAHILTRDEKLTTGRLMGVLVGFAGVTVMIGTDLTSGLGSNVLAQCACLLATLSYALGAVFSRRFKRLGVTPMQVAGGQFVASSAILIPVALLVDQPWQIAPPSWQAIAAIVALAMFSTALGFVIYFRVMASAGSNVNLVTLLVPVSAILLGVLVLGESLELRHLAGMAAIALGLLAIDGRLFRRR